MHELLDVRPWPRVLLRYPLLILMALLLGALSAFSYSYAPLHRAKDWKIDYLEERLESRNEQILELEESLVRARASLDETLSGEEIEAIRARLKEASRLAESREKETASLKKKLDQATKSLDQSRSRHAAARAEMEKQEQQAALAASEPPARPVAAAEPELPLAPAAPAAAAPEGFDPTGEATETDAAPDAA